MCSKSLPRLCLSFYFFFTSVMHFFLPKQDGKYVYVKYGYIERKGMCVCVDRIYVKGECTSAHRHTHICVHCVRIHTTEPI